MTASHGQRGHPPWCAHTPLIATTLVVVTITTLFQAPATAITVVLSGMAITRPGQTIDVIENSDPALSIGDVRCLVSTDSLDFLVAEVFNGWMHNDVPIPNTNGSRLRVTFRQSLDGSFLFTNVLRWPETVTTALAGTYRCEVRNSTASFQIRVVEPARIVSVSEVLQLQFGEAASLQCSASGTAPVTIVWLRDGISVLSASQTALALSIPTPSQADTAEYTCAASNTFGTDSRSVNITVVVHPRLAVGAAPRLREDSLASRQASFGVAPPEFDGNSPLQHYILQCTPTRSTSFTAVRRVQASTTTLTVEGLHPGEAYDCVYYAANLLFTSQTSSRVTSIRTPDSMSAAPRRLAILSATATTLNVGFQPPVDHATFGTVLGYIVFYNTSCGRMLCACNAGTNCSLSGTVNVTSSSDTAVVLRGLRSNATYSISVRAVNRAGLGRPAFVSAQTEPEALVDIRASRIAQTSLPVLIGSIVGGVSGGALLILVALLWARHHQGTGRIATAERRHRIDAPVLNNLRQTSDGKRNGQGQAEAASPTTSEELYRESPYSTSRNSPAYFTSRCSPAYSEIGAIDKAVSYSVAFIEIDNQDGRAVPVHTRVKTRLDSRTSAV